MTHDFAGKNSDVAWPPNGNSGQPPVMALFCRCSDRLASRSWSFVLSVCCFLLGILAVSSDVNAQSSRSSGLSSPDDSVTQPLSDLAVPTRPNRASIKSKSAKGDIRQTSSSFDENDEAPKTVFQLEEPLIEVLIEGNTTIPKSEVSKHIKTRPGRPVTQKQIKDDVDALVRTRWFASVEPALRPTDDGVVLVFRVLERPIVRRVEYKGLKKMKQKTFDALTQLKPGSPFDIGSNRECARRIEEYYHEKGFAFATVELEKGNDRDDREVVFLINEGPKVHVTAVKFEGNEEFIDGILKSKTRTKSRILWLFGGKYDPSSIKDDIEGVKQYYHSLGYFDVEIKEHLKFSDNKANVEFHYEVSEGIRYKIRNIEIVGNGVLSEDELRDMMKVEGNTLYSARDINKDMETIKTKYGEQGRLFCQVDAVPRYTEDEGIVDIVYKINEDKVYRIRHHNIHIMGDRPHTRTNLPRNIAMIQPGDLADPRQIHLTKTRLAGSQNFEAGQANGVRVETNIVKDETWVAQPEYGAVRSQSADYPPSAKPIVPPLVQGPDQQAAPTTDPTAQRLSPNGIYGLYGWIGTKASRAESRDPFVSVASYFDERTERLAVPTTQPKLVADDGLSPLTPIFRAQSKDPIQPPANFGFDNSPQGDPFGRGIRNPDPDDLERVPPAFVDLDTYLTEARSGRLMFGVGVNSDAGLVGNIVLSEQNFDILRPPTSWNDIANGQAWRGNGEKFKIEAMPGTQVSRYLVDWQNPYFLDTNFNLGVSGFYFMRYYRNWDEERTGGRISLGRQLTKRWSARAALRLEDIDVYNATVPTPQILANALGFSLLSTIRGSIIHDTRDAAFNTGEGHYLELSYEQAFGQYSYPRVELEGRQYFTTYRRVDGQGKHTITLRGQTSWTGSDTPVFERFFAGGFQTFRGFAFRGVSPSDTGVLIGGDFLALGSAEYQLPVVANEMVKIVGFTDFGTVNNNVSLSDFRVSVGGGFRVSVPMMGPVPIAIDFAVPILQQQTDIKQVISFYVGVNR